MVVVGRWEGHVRGTGTGTVFERVRGRCGLVRGANHRESTLARSEYARGLDGGWVVVVEWREGDYVGNHDKWAAGPR